MTSAARALVERYVDLYPAEVAGALERRDVDEIVAALDRETPPHAAAVFTRLTLDTAARVAAAMPLESAARILPLLDPDRAAPLLGRLDEEIRNPLLGLLDDAAARELRTLMSYPADSAGSLMDTQVTTFRPETTASEALDRLRSWGEKRVLGVNVVDTEGRLKGRIPLQDLALAAPDERIEGLIDGPPVAVQVTANREEVVEELTRRQLTSLPVVDFEGRLLGVIRNDALVQAVQDEVTADMQTMVGASKDERALSKVSFAVRKRLPWLQINLLTAFLAASVVGMFEATIAKFTALAVLLPVVAGQSGNTGAQALAVTMRGLAVREIRVRQWFRVSRKEVAVALINGVAVALTTALGVLVWSQSVGLALVIGVSMVISMIAAGFSGAVIPMVLTALGQDPAQSSSIILTTVTDVVGFFSFLGIATMLASML